MATRKMKIEIEYTTDEKDGGVHNRQFSIYEINSAGDKGLVWSREEPSFMQALGQQLAEQAFFEEMTRYRYASENGLTVTVEPGVINNDPTISQAVAYAPR